MLLQLLLMIFHSSRRMFLSIQVKICAKCSLIGVKMCSPVVVWRVVIMGSFRAVHPCLYSTKPNIFRTPGTVMRDKRATYV